MNFKMIVNGETFVSGEVDEKDLKANEEHLYETINSMNKFQFFCHDGRVVTLAGTALKSAIFIFDYNKV